MTMTMIMIMIELNAKEWFFEFLFSCVVSVRLRIIEIYVDIRCFRFKCDLVCQTRRLGFREK